MDNRERRESIPVIEACADLLAPPRDWEPDLHSARLHFQMRVSARLHRRSRVKRYFVATAVAAVLACIAVPAIPQTRWSAYRIADDSWHRLEQLWYWITVVRAGPVLLGRLPDAIQDLHIRRPVQPESPLVVSNASEAAARAGFVPRFPDAALSGVPRLSVLGPTSLSVVIDSSELAESLRKAGAADQPVPQQWDGAELTLQIAATVTATWRQTSDSSGLGWTDLTLTQSPARIHAVPSLVDLETFAAAGLRAAGMRNREMVSRLARRSTTLPALLFGYRSPYDFVGVRDVNLETGPATLIEEFGAAAEKDGIPKVERITLLWSVGDRVYVLSGRPNSRPGMISAGLAAAVAGAINLANSI